MTRKLQRGASFVCALLVAGILYGAALAADQADISPERLRKHVEFLASPAMKGRGTGTPELDRAARYIRDEFQQAGLKPMSGRSYFQEFKLTVGGGLGPRNSAESRAAISAKPLVLKQDYIPLNISDSGSATMPLVFAGYGISSTEHGYDDYAHIATKDSAVIVLRHEPQEDNENSIFAGRQLTVHAHIVNKAINARQHGARAMILVNDPVPHAGEPDELVRFGSVTGPDNSGLLVIHATRDVVDQWLAPSGKTLVQLQKAIDEKLQPLSYALEGTTLKLEVDVRRIPAITRNVVGMLPGRDPALSPQAIIVGAHYDHLGLGERNSLSPSSAGKVHPGADDNASGTAALIEIARSLSQRQRDLGRSVIFIAFSGEELGLLGSSYYVKHPMWPLERTAAMLNLDMVGRPREGKLNVGGVGSSAEFRKIVQEANRTRLSITFSSSGLAGSSDHMSFYTKDVPVIFFFSGLHADYHKPSDTSEKILYAEEARVADLAMRTAQALTSVREKPAFVRVQETQPAMGVGGGSGYGAYFGSIPDMGEDVVGVKFADVRDGSPAAQAGLKAGDILVEFAGKEIRNLYDFTFALRNHKPGEKVRVTVLRGTERLTVEVTLAVRR